jgi:hypothetical protein
MPSKPPFKPGETKESQLLTWLLEEMKAANEQARCCCDELHVISKKIDQLLPELADVEFFTFTQENSMQPFTPGTSPAPVITITPNNPLSATQPVPVTVSSDPTNYPISVDPTGLLVTVNTVAQTAAGFTLTTTYTNADAVVASSTSQVFGASGTGSADVTSFTFAQTT